MLERIIFTTLVLLTQNEISLELENLLAKKRRRKLIPIWVKVFIWIFMIFGALVVPVFLAALSGYNTSLSLYGLETHDGLSITGLIIFALFILKGVTALGLWTENDWAITCGIVDAVSGIIICLAFLVAPLFNKQLLFTFRLELIPLVPYLIWLLRIKPKWESTS